MNYKVNALAVAILSVMLSVTSANAATYIINYAGMDGSTAHFNVTTSNALNAVGGYNVTAITGGDVNGDAITGIVSNPNQPDPFTNSAWQYDDVLFSKDARFVDYYGIVATLASGGTTNLFSRSPTDFELMIAPASGGYSLDSHGLAWMAAAVPEPATWAMLNVGVLAIGIVLRRSRKAQRDAVVA